MIAQIHLYATSWQTTAANDAMSGCNSRLILKSLGNGLMYSLLCTTAVVSCLRKSVGAECVITWVLNVEMLAVQRGRPAHRGRRGTPDTPRGAC